MLAQEWLYGSRVPSKFDSYVERHLALPSEFNPHSTLAVLNRLAERIVFTDDVPSLLYDLHENKQLSYDGMIASARLPYDIFWLEYSTKIDTWYRESDELTSIGALVQRIGVNAVRMYIIVGLRVSNKPEFYSTLAYVIEFDEWPPLTNSKSDEWALKFSIAYAFNERKLWNEANTKRKGQIAEIGSMVSEIIFGIFLVTQPKVYSVDTIAWKASHKKARALKGKAPLLEYKKLKLHIGRPHKHYAQRPAITPSNSVETDSEAARAHRRYHKVMGHFRHYNDHDPPHTTWIEAHYRGDPSLGVTFTERDVTR